MNLPQENLKYNIFNILKDLNNKKRDKNNLLEYYVNLRLNKSLDSYYESLLRLENKILNKKPEKIIRNINRHGI